MPITIQARRDLVRQCTRLSVWLARRLAREGMTMRQALATCTNVYRFTRLWDGKNHPAEPPPGWRDEQWESLLDAFDRLDAGFPAEDATAELEAAALELFWPWMEPRLQQDVAAWPAPESKPFGFFNYKPGDEGWESGRIALHLNNPFAPRSPFDDPGQRANELAALLHHARRENSALHTVSLQSWLAGFGPLQALFPAVFAANSSGPSRLAYHLGWWGQFIDRAGGFHEKNGDYLRRTGRFRYPCISCACSIEAALGHLRDRFGITENSGGRS